jgi:amino acid permease
LFDVSLEVSLFLSQTIFAFFRLCLGQLRTDFSAPKYQVELKDNTIPRFRTVVALGFGISILLTAWIASIGFATFGGACQGLVLNNYSTNDLIMSASRSAVAISLIFSYPLAFQGCRDGFLDLLGVRDRSPSKINVMTVIVLLALTALATVLKDVSFVLAFGGATLGNLLCYVYPALMYMRVRPDMRIPAVGLAVSGVVLGAIGAKLALNKL